MLAPALALLVSGCVERQELFPVPGSGGAGNSSPGGGEATEFHLISIGAHAQTNPNPELSGLGAAIILRDQQVLFWGNGGGGTAGRGFSVAVVNPDTHALIGAVETFDTFATRMSGGDEAGQLAEFLEQVADGMLVLLVVGDDAGLTENGVDGQACEFLTDTGTRAALDQLTALGSSEIDQYCYRASFAMAAYKGADQAAAESLIDRAPAHVTFTLE